MDSYCSKTIDCEDFISFPQVDEATFMDMALQFQENEDAVYFFPFLTRSEIGTMYDQLYVWDYMLYPKCYTRFVFADGRRMKQINEKNFLQYLSQLRNGQLIGCTSETILSKFCRDVCEAIGEWHYRIYDTNELSKALNHLYYVSFPSGPRELLYKADLDYIAYMAEYYPKPEGTSLAEIFDLPIRLLRLFNGPILFDYLRTEQSLEQCKEINRVYGTYLGGHGSAISTSQWLYLEKVFREGETLFDKKLFHKLAECEGEWPVIQYLRFVEERDEMKEMRMKKLPLPNPSEVDYMVEKLKYIREKLEDKQTMNDSLIRVQAILKRELEYRSMDGCLFVRLPQNSTDMYLESIEQGNCLMESYMDRHAGDETTIAFLRRVKEPDKSFVTLEIHGGRLVQARGKYNALPDEETLNFLENEYSVIKSIEYCVDMEEYDEP